MNGLTKFYCRAYQKVFKVVSDTIMPWRVPELITGAGSIKKLPNFIAENVGMDCLTQINTYTARISDILQRERERFPLPHCDTKAPRSRRERT